MPGWEVFQRLTEKATAMHQRRAIASSQDDPLSNRDQIATAWAYFQLYRRAIEELAAMVNVEVAGLETNDED
jgi:hypothetical protein